MIIDISCAKNIIDEFVLSYNREGLYMDQEESNNKPASENNRKIGYSITTALAILTIIITIVVSIPAFLSLNEEHSEIYYSYSSSVIQIPSTLNEDDVKQILLDNGIPQNTLTVTVINQGNGFAEEVLISIEVPGEIITAWSSPSKQDSPIWVEIPDIDITQQPKRVIIPVKSMATTKPIFFNIGYSPTEDGIEQVEVFYNGTPAEKVTDGASVSPWSPWKVFYLPLGILAVGLAIILIWAFFIVLINNPAQKEALLKLATEIGKEVAETAARSLFRLF